MNDEGAVNLANGIIIKAADDYRLALREIDKAKSDNAKVQANRIKVECELFFKSSWFKVLTQADGPAILSALQKEHEDREGTKAKTKA